MLQRSMQYSIGNPSSGTIEILIAGKSEANYSDSMSK